MAAKMMHRKLSSNPLTVPEVFTHCLAPTFYDPVTIIHL